MRQLRADMHLKVDSFVDKLGGLTLYHSDQNAVEIDRNIMKIKQDKVLDMEQQ